MDPTVVRAKRENKGGRPGGRGGGRGGREGGREGGKGGGNAATDGFCSNLMSRPTMRNVSLQWPRTTLLNRGQGVHPAGVPLTLTSPSLELRCIPLSTEHLAPAELKGGGRGRGVWEGGSMEATSRCTISPSGDPIRRRRCGLKRIGNARRTEGASTTDCLAGWTPGVEG